MTYANLAREHGVREYRVVPALNDHPLLIEALKTLALDTLKEAHA
jgi:protoheme ferro-lyase